MQYFPSDELIKSLVKTGVMTVQLASGSYMKVGGQGYQLLVNLDLNMSTVGFGGLDIGSPALQTQYYVYVVINGAGNLGLVASLNAYQPTGFTSYKLIGKVEFDSTLSVTVVNADFINEVQESQIESIQLTLSQATTNITTLQNQLASQGSAASALDGRVTANENAITALQALTGTHTGQISTIQGNISTLQSTVGGHTTSIGTLQTQMTAAQNSITSLGSQDSIFSTNIGNLQTASSGHETRIGNVEAKFNPLSGHSHNGLDAPRIKAIDLGTDEGTTGDVFSIDSNGDAIWVPINLPTPEVKVNCIDLEWVEGTVNSPTKQVNLVGSALAYYYFAMGAGGNGQKLYTSFKVPGTYIPGKKITFSFLSHTATADSASTHQFACTSYLVKPGVLTSSSALSHLATGTTITAGSTPDALVSQTFDLTTASGAIAAQAVAAGDLIHLMIEKLDTGLSEDNNATSVLYNGVEVVFNV